MYSLEAVEKGLPPGLWLPTPDEPIDIYKRENFSHGRHAYEDVLDFGVFVVARTFHCQTETGRVSLMPVTSDLEALYDEGYGLSTKVLSTHYGGLTRLDKELGFFPREYEPTDVEVIKRFGWIAEYGYSLDPLPSGEVRKVEEILEWGAERHLTPSPGKVYRVLNGDTSPIRKMFNVEMRDRHNQYRRSRFYSFGAQVLAECSKPLSEQELNQKYPDAFTGQAGGVVRWRLGSLTRFWMEFDRLPARSAGLTEQDVANFGVRWAIANGTPYIDTETINRLSGEGKFPSRILLNKYFDGIPDFRARVMNDYQAYLDLRRECEQVGVEACVFKAIAGRKFEATPDFKTKIKDNLRVFKILSNGTEESSYVLSIVQRGFNLLDDVIMDMQMEDFKKCLRRLGIRDRSQLRFIFDMVPLIDSDEFLGPE